MEFNLPIQISDYYLKKAIDLGLNPADVLERFVRGSGKGGQKINKTSSCVWLKHLPTGIAVKCQMYREQSKNRISAWRLLINKIDLKVKGNQSEIAREIYKIKKQKQRRSRKAREKMREIKKLRSVIKENRRKVEI